MARVLGKLTVALTSVALAVIAAPSCSTTTISAEDCDYVVTRCRTYCDYCGGYGGYGYGYGYYGCCYDRCWSECIGDGKRDKAPNADPPPAPAPQPPADVDAGAPTTDAGPPGDFAVLCQPCQANDECRGGGLCIIRGGEDAGTAGFCGTPCSTSADCPAEFTCTEIGQSKQCVPTSGTCN
jgi:hypothetical protein